MSYSNLSSFESLPALFFSQARVRDDAILFSKLKGSKISTYTWRRADQHVRRIAAGLIRLGLRPGERVALMADNGPEPAFCDLAVQAAGGVVVPIYTTLTTREICHILENSQSRFFFLGKRSVLPQVKESFQSLTAPPVLVMLDSAKQSTSEDHSPSAMTEQAPSQEELAEVSTRTEVLTRDSLSAIIYTSGTTGPSKGVMITHGNILSNLEAAWKAMPINQNDLFLSFLPMSHIFERAMSLYAVIAIGACIHFAHSIGTVARDFAEASPTVAMVVPRFLEKLRQRALNALQEAKPPARILAETALNLGLMHARKKRRGEPIPLWLKISKPAGDAVMKKVRNKLGGRIRFLVSGGAALNGSLWDFFEAVGITVLQGYGLTETSAAVSVNRMDRNRPDSVGLPVESVSVRIADDGELELYGPSITKGYWQLKDETQEAFTKDGWFKTGDIARVDADGFLYITDRKKDLIVSSSGKNIAPQNIENALCLDPLIEFACILGEGKRSLGALISPNPEALGEAAAKMGIESNDPAALTDDARIVNLYQGVIDQVNSGLAPYERISRFHLVDKPFSREGGTLTPTLKVRRKMVETQYKQAIETLFNPRSGEKEETR